MKLLILGANGQVGHCLVEQATAKGIDYIATDSSQLDITDFSKVADVINQANPTCVINATAYTNVEKAEDEADKAFMVNGDSLGNLAKVCSEKDIPLIHISTDYVFDGTKDGFYQETDAVNPINVYGRSKLDGEIAVSENTKKYIIMRTSWVFGRHGKNFVKTMINLFKSRTELTVVNDQIGGPTFAGDIADRILRIADVLNKNKEFTDWGIYNFSGKPDVSWFDFANCIYNSCKKNGIQINDVTINPIAAENFKTKAVRPLNSKLDLTIISEVFGVEPCDWKKEIENNINYYNS